MSSTWFEDELLDVDRLGPVVREALESVRGALDRARMPHAVMLVGPAGLGRELAAVEVAAMMVCRQEGLVGCTCSSCQRVRRGLHPDVAVLRGEGKKNIIKIEPIRQIVTEAPGRPYEGAARVWILDGVEGGRFGQEAANAFLKVLEEPPEHVRFVLLAANPEAVLATIRSRCQGLALPGPVQVARLLGEESGPEELAALGDEGREAAAQVEAVREGLEEALSGEVLGLLRAARRAGSTPFGLEAAALAVTEVATTADPEVGEGLSRLAEDLMRSARLTVALNLEAERQLLACLLHWYETEVKDG